jgi:hypothetical protein
MQATSNSTITPDQLQTIVNQDITQDVAEIIEQLEIEIQAGPIGERISDLERQLLPHFTNEQHALYINIDALAIGLSFDLACAAFRAGIMFAGHPAGMAPDCPAA